MPPLPNVGSVAKVRLVGTNQSVTWNNVMHEQYSGGAPTAGTLQSLAAAVGNAWISAIAPICNTSSALTEVVCIDLATSTGNEGTATVNHVGTRAGTVMPVSTAVVFSFHVQLRYRGGHARMYVPGGVAADISAGRLWNTSSQTAFASAASSFLSQVNAITIGGSAFFMVMVSYRTNHALRPVPAVFPIVSTGVDDRIDNQRRRLGKPV